MSTYNYTSSVPDTQVSAPTVPATAHLTRECDPEHGGCTASPAAGECSAADWSPADLAVIVREYLDLPVPPEDLDRVGINPALRGLLNAVRTNPGSDRTVQDWAANLPPDLRDAFAAAWRDAFAAAWDAARRQNEPQNRNGDTHQATGDTPAGEAGEAEKEAEARAIADRLESRPLTRLYKHTDIGNGERLAQQVWRRGPVLSPVGQVALLGRPPLGPRPSGGPLPVRETHGKGDRNGGNVVRG